MKTNKILFGIAIAVIIYLGISSFGVFNRNSIKGSGTLLKESRELATFHSLEVGGAFNVTLKQGSPQSVIITTDDNLMPHIITKVKNGELEIYTKGSIQRSTKLTVEIIVQNIDEIDLSGACNLQTTNYISSNNMEIEGSGASTFKMQLKCKKLSLDFSGASNADMIGSTKTLAIIASGASSIDCSKLHAEVVNIDASGASSVEVIADKLLTVDASGASSVDYSGKASATVETSGASSVEKK
jgi:hypothetical protein